MRKLLPALVLVATAALGLTGCDLHLAPYAAVVDGKTISQQTLDDALAKAASDTDYICALTSNYQSPIATYGVGTGTYDEHFTAYVLATFVRAQLAADEAAQQHLQVTSLLEPVAMTQVTGGFGSAAGCPGTAAKVFSGLSPAYQQALLTLYENLDLLGAAQDGATLTTEGLAAYVAAHPAAALLTCINYIEVASKSTADTAEKALQTVPFTQEAASVSTSTTTTVGCIPLSQLSSALAAPVAALPTGEYTQPISFQGGYVILQVSDRKPASGSVLLDLVIANAAQRFAGLLTRLDTSTSVQLDPAYGTWSATGGSAPAIREPAGPPSQFVPSVSAATPATVSAPSAATPGTAGG